MRIYTIDRESVSYPRRLLTISNPPDKLYCAGDTDLLNGGAGVAVVGSRKYSLYGKQTAMMIGRHLASSGITVISGLAYGIDAFAHQGTLENGGKAIAVLGTALDRFYPKKNEPVFREILEKGLVVTEYEAGFKGSRYSFPARNRIISGLSDAVVVVEAGIRSGSLITAQFALDQGREVYAVPGNINSQFSAGTNMLIRDGATPMIVIDDLIRNLGVEPKKESGIEIPLGRDEIEVLEAVRENNGVHVNEISHRLNRTVGQVNAIITVLEIKGAVLSYSGKIYLAK